VEGSSRGLIYGIIKTAAWKYWENPQKISQDTRSFWLRNKIANCYSVTNIYSC